MITFDHVSKTYPNGVKGLVDINLTIPDGEYVSIIGLSGAGKSTLLRLAAGLSTPQQGRISSSLPGALSQQVAWMGQRDDLYPWLSVRDNVMLSARLSGQRPDNRRAEALLAQVELAGLGDARPDSLSGGMRQRVALARTLYQDRQVVLMDEPFAALDSQRKNEILPYLQRLHDELDIPVLYVSHAQDEVARLADHLVLLSDGKALASGPIGETLARLDLPMALGDDAGVIIEGQVSAYDAEYQLLSLQLPATAMNIRVTHAPMAVGQALRCKVHARDISLALHNSEASSILNRLPVTVVSELAADNAAHVLIRLDAGGTPLLARITRFSRDQLGIHPGQHLWAQIKAVAVLA